MDFDLRGRRALISGSSSGIGAGIAKGLAKEGVCVIVHGRDAARAEAVKADILAAGGQAVCALGDLTSEAGADSVCQVASAAFGGIDILVNNAGGRPAGSRPTAWFDIPVADWGATYEMNVTAAVRLIHRLVPAMTKGGWGRVINVSSLAGHTPSERLAAYAASKAAMINMTVSLSKHLARTGVTANTICPGMVRTDMLDALLVKTAQDAGLGSDREAGERIMTKRFSQSVGRLGEVADVAAMVCYLASDLGGFISGANFHVDGGATPSIA
jgi:3-oxoacyl-[acyl-carrier protein] reductase